MQRQRNLLTLLFTALTFGILLPTAGTVRGQDKPEDKKTYVLVRGDIRPKGTILAGIIEIGFGESMPEEYINVSEDPNPNLTRVLPSGTKVSSFSLRLPATEWRVQATRIKEGNGEQVGHTVWLRPAFIRRSGDPSDRTVVLEFNGMPEVKPKTDASGNLILDANGKPVMEETGRFIITGQPSDRLDPTTHQIMVFLRRDNFPSVVLGSPQKKGIKKAFTAAKGEGDADIYVSGTITAARKSKPLYALETRFAYLQSLKKFGAIGGSFALDSNEESNIDPDSIRAAATYEYVKPFRSGTGLILRSNVIGGEFNRKDTVRNLITGLDAKLVLPSAPLGETTFITADFTFGFEAGNNYRNKLAPQGIGAFWRPKFGAAAYFLALHTPIFDRISINANYEVRLPRSAEIYSEMQGDNEIFSLTKKPRHRVGTDLNFLFTDAYGISLQYRYGTLPPSFKLEESNVKLGFIIQLKQANR